MRSKQSYQLYKARHALKVVLRVRQNDSEKELRHIEEILKKATEEIRQKE